MLSYSFGKWSGAVNIFCTPKIENDSPPKNSFLITIFKRYLSYSNSKFVSFPKNYVTFGDTMRMFLFEFLIS